LGKPAFADPRYFPKELSLSNFHLVDLPSVEGRLCFVDGGNMELINTPGLVVHLTRVGYCVYTNNSRVEISEAPQCIDFYTLAYASKMGDGIKYSLELVPRIEAFRKYLPDEKDLVFSSFDRTLMEGQTRALLSRVATASRIFAEWKLAEILSSSYLAPGDILIRDGSLQTQVTGESKYSNRAYEEAVKKGVIFTGLAKTSTLFTDSGMPLFSAVSILAKRNELEEKRWFYYPIVDIQAPDHKAEMMAVRLHPRSKYVFRFEILKEQAQKISNYQLIVAQIASNAIDAVFPGYPYGLIEADRVSRVREEEVEPLQLQLFSSFSKLGAWGEVEAFMRAVDAHQIIDEI
jgi:hypothetical protein